MAFTREVADGRAIRGESVALATRGERLALVRSTFVFADADVGPSEITFLLVTEVDEHGRIAAYVRFDDDDLEAAYAELDARFERGEGAAHPLAAKWLADYLRNFATRDWDAMRALFAPDLVGHNHRLVGWGTLQGPAALVSTLGAQIALAPDTQERVDHVQYAPDFVRDDRRPLVGLSGDLELMVASARERLASGARHERRTILGTASDRVAIGRVLWAGGPRRLRERVRVAEPRERRSHHPCRAVRGRAAGRCARALRGAASRSAADSAERGDARGR